MVTVQNGVETLPKISPGCTNVTDRQTTDGFAIVPISEPKYAQCWSQILKVRQKILEMTPGYPLLISISLVWCVLTICWSYF